MACRIHQVEPASPEPLYIAAVGLQVLVWAWWVVGSPLLNPVMERLDGRVGPLCFEYCQPLAWGQVAAFTGSPRAEV